MVLDSHSLYEVLMALGSVLTVGESFLVPQYVLDHKTK